MFGTRDRVFRKNTLPFPLCCLIPHDRTYGGAIDRVCAVSNIARHTETSRYAGGAKRARGPLTIAYTLAVRGHNCLQLAAPCAALIAVHTPDERTTMRATARASDSILVLISCLAIAACRNSSGPPPDRQRQPHRIKHALVVCAQSRAMMNKPLVDSACRALAEHFHPTGTNAQLSDLAKLLEDVAVEFVHGRRNGRTLSLISSEKAVSLSRLALRIRLAEIAYAKALVALYPVNTPATYIQNRRSEVGCTVIGHSGRPGEGTWPLGCGILCSRGANGPANTGRRRALA